MDTITLQKCKMEKSNENKHNNTNNDNHTNNNRCINMNEIKILEYRIEEIEKRIRQIGTLIKELEYEIKSKQKWKNI